MNFIFGSCDKSVRAKRNGAAASVERRWREPDRAISSPRVSELCSHTLLLVFVRISIPFVDRVVAFSRLKSCLLFVFDRPLVK